MKPGIVRASLVTAVTAALLLLPLWLLLTQPLFPPAGSSPRNLPLPDKMALERHVRAISEVLSPRSWEHEVNLEDVAGYMATEWERAGIPPQQQEFSARKSSYKNVFVELGPDTKEVIVVGAHYDAAGTYPGADDNASGVAGVIELAKLLKAQTLKRRVILIGYSLEEPPFFTTEEMGSVAHAKALKAMNKEVKAMLSLEMIGYFSDQPGSQEFPFPLLHLFYPNRGNFIALAGDLGVIPLTRRVKRAMMQTNELPVYSINAPSAVPGIDFSDHRSYRAEGSPALMVTDTAFYRNKNYHTANDTADTLDYRRMVLVVQGVLAAVLDLASD